MPIERVGQFIEFIGDEGIRHLVRMSAIQHICDTDEMAEETFLTVANRTLLVRAPLDELRDALADAGSPRKG